MIINKEHAHSFIMSNYEHFQKDNVIFSQKEDLSFSVLKNEPYNIGLIKDLINDSETRFYVKDESVECFFEQYVKVAEKYKKTNLDFYNKLIGSYIARKSLIIEKEEFIDIKIVFSSDRVMFLPKQQVRIYPSLIFNTKIKSSEWKSIRIFKNLHHRVIMDFRIKNYNMMSNHEKLIISSYYDSIRWPS